MRLPRILPQSLLGQVMLVLALGLFVGQALSAFLLYQAAEQRREAVLANAIVFRMIVETAGPERADRREALRRARIETQPRGERPFRGRFRIAVETTAINPIAPDEARMHRFEDTLQALLEDQGIEASTIHVTHRRAGDDPFAQAFFRDRPRLRIPKWEDNRLIVAAVQRAERGDWLVTRMPTPNNQQAAIRSIIVQTVVIFLILVVLLYFVLRRLTRPLAQLTTRVADFSRDPGKAIAIEERGPADTRQLIAAHNAMEARIAGLLDEKDVMLGAIGHDLKTPLAALRVRIESVADETQRKRMAESIEDITTTLDDILSLARIGRAGGEREKVELTALADSVVEEFEDLGQPVTLANAQRAVASIHTTWLKRALRNLVSNAVRYGGSAHVSVHKEGPWVTLRVEDDGPGIPPDRIADMLEPFTRGEVSRNRATGGAGLGLTLARAVAEQHAGNLVIENRQQGGLRAEIRFPA